MLEHPMLLKFEMDYKYKRVRGGGRRERESERYEEGRRYIKLKIRK